MGKEKALKVVFDTNTLANDSFDVLEKSRMVELVERGRIIPIYGHVFLEESYRAYGSEKHRKHLVERRLPFIAKTVRLFCEDFITIWHRELVQGRGIHAPIYLDERRSSTIRRAFVNVPVDGSWKAWASTATVRTEEAQKRANQRELSKQIREETKDWLARNAEFVAKHGFPGIGEFIRRSLVPVARDFIHGLVKCSNPQAVYNRWSRDPYGYPFFTQFMENLLYIVYHAAVKKEAIDPNAQADLDVMTHLLRADYLVSNERRFLRIAFDELWRPRGKQLFTAEEFAKYMQKL